MKSCIYNTFSHRLFKALVLLYLLMVVECQLSLPLTPDEIKAIQSMSDLVCNRRSQRDDACAGKRRKGGRNRKRESGPTEDSENNGRRKCRCRRRHKESARPERAMLDDPRPAPQNDFVTPRPKMKICSGLRCLTFTNGRRSFNSAEYSIVANSSFIEVVEGTWEVCGEFEEAISCTFLGDESYIQLFPGEKVRVTTFRKMELPTTIPTGLPNNRDDRELGQQIGALGSQLSELSENIFEMEATIDRSTKLLLLDRHKNLQMRRKLRKIMNDLDNT